MINDMTKGGPLSLIFWFSVPLLIGNIFQQLYNIADIVIVGRTIGIDALAAVGAISPIFLQGKDLVQKMKKELGVQLLHLLY